MVYFKLIKQFPALKRLNRCLIFEIMPSLMLIFFKNLPSFKIDAYSLVLIKDNALDLQAWHINIFFFDFFGGCFRKKEILLAVESFDYFYLF